MTLFERYFEIDDGYSVLPHRNGLELIHRVPFGKLNDPAAEVSVVIHISMNPPFDGPERCMELKFSILVNLDGTLRHIDDGRETKAFLAEAERELALRVICIETIKMLSILSPDSLVMSTMTSDLPEKALRKYDVISRAIRAAGYQGGRGDRFNGDQIWMFEKIA